MQATARAAKMRLVLPLLCVLCAARVRGVFDGTCLRKDPPPGVLVLSPGSKLVLTCRGHVMVNGRTVNITSNGSVAPTVAGNSDNKLRVGSTARVLSPSNSGVTGGSRRPRYTDTGTTASPTTPGVRQTAASRPPTTESSREHEGKSSVLGDYDDDEEEEEEEGNRVTRGTHSRPQWKWNGQTVGTGRRDWGEIRTERRGAVLSLPSARPTDSGSYTCHHRGGERFSVKVIVADPPQAPSLSCYKRSHTSKIRCEAETQKPTTRPFSCYLLLNKSPSSTFRQMPCSCSARPSRYWCALENNASELRTVHSAYLCVTSITGNVTSNELSFSPVDIIKPDPPSSVKLHQVQGRQTYMRVTWANPSNWKSHNNYYKLIYELKYKPVQSAFHYEQTKSSGTMMSEITDVMPGVQYQVQVRNKDEFDGHWSEWSAPVTGRSWPEPRVATTQSPQSVCYEGSTFTSEGPVITEPAVEETSYHALWISCPFLLLTLILGVYVFRHKDRFVPKVHHLSSIRSGHSDSSQPPVVGPAAHEVQGLVTFAPRCYNEHQQSNTEEAEEENEEEQREEDRMEAVHFNNTSYFLV